MAQLSENKNNPERLVKEVLNTDNIRGKTELNVVQIESVNKLRTIASVFGNDLLDNHLDDFMVLQLSKDRKSRLEFVDAVKSKITDMMDKAKKFSFSG